MLWPRMDSNESMPYPPLESRWHAIEDKRVLLRLDLNVPLTEQEGVSLEHRLRRIGPLVRKLARLASRVVLISHLGRPHGQTNPALSLRAYADFLAQRIGLPVTFVPACRGRMVEDAVNAAPRGSVLLLENLRFDVGEETADPAFARDLARCADCFVNEAFSVSHRRHASVTQLPLLLPTYVGGAFMESYLRAKDLLESMRGPVVVLAGGGKADKLRTYGKLLPKIDSLLLCSFLATQHARQPWILGDTTGGRDRIVLPPDLLVAADGEAEGRQLRTIRWGEQGDGLPVDIGPQATELFAERIRRAGTVIVNGAPGILHPDDPMASNRGLFEAFGQTDAVKVVCGGTGCALYLRDSLACSVDYVFSGGGATLAFIASDCVLGSSRLATASAIAMSGVSPAPAALGDRAVPHLQAVWQ